MSNDRNVSPAVPQALRNSLESSQADLVAARTEDFDEYLARMSRLVAERIDEIKRAQEAECLPEMRSPAPHR